jgi:hypothetical protein
MFDVADDMTFLPLTPLKEWSAPRLTRAEDRGEHFDCRPSVSQKGAAGQLARLQLCPIFSPECVGATAD